MMKRLFLLAVVIFLSAVSAQAQPAARWAVISEFVVCVSPGETAPDFSSPECGRQKLGEIDPQGQSLWLKSSIDIPTALSASDEPVGLFISGKTSSAIYLNDVLIGENGVPGANRQSEVPGMMDVVFFVPEKLIRPGANDLVLHLSAHRGLMRLDYPVHQIAIGPYQQPTDMILRVYWPSLITFGAFMLGGFYFGVRAIQPNGRSASLVLCLISLLAAGQLISESARGLFAYPYPFHDTRLILILLFSAGFGMCLVAHVAERFLTQRRLVFVGTIATISLAGIIFTPGFDGKSVVALILPTLCCAAAALFWAYKKKPQAIVYAIAFAGFAGLSVLFQQRFLDVFFYYAVAALLVFLFAQQAVRMAREQNLRLAEQERARRLELSLEQARQRDRPVQIKIKSAGKIDLVAIDQISHCNGAGDYVELCLKGGAVMLHGGSLNELEASLPPTFLRVHRSHIVNTDYVKSLEREASGGGTLLMAGGERVPVSRRIMPQVRTALD